MSDQDINTINQQPEQTAPSATVGVRVFEDVYRSGRDYDSETGKHSLGVADPQNVTAELVPTLESVTAGAQNISLEELVTGWNGTANVTTQDQNTKMTGAAVGTTISDVVDNYPDTPVTAEIAATGSTLNTIALVADAAAAFAAHRGRAIEIPTVSGRKMRNYIANVNTDTDVITLFYGMDELPLPAGDIQLLEGFQQEVGGGQLGMRELLFAQDFSNGASHRSVIWKVQSIGGWKPIMTQGTKVIQQAQFKIQGVTRTVASTAQLVPVTVFGKYGRAPIAS